MRHHRLSEIPEERVNPLLTRRFFTGEHVTMAFVKLEPGCRVPLHQHVNEQFTYAVSGALHLRIGGEAVVLRAGELVEIPPDVPHEAWTEEEFTGIDVFSPIRADWLSGNDAYLRQPQKVER